MDTLKETYMTTQNFSIGDFFTVLTPFSCDGKVFSTGKQGTILHIEHDDWDGSNRYFIEWTHTENGFHDCAQRCQSGYGWAIPTEKVDWNCISESETATKNPLPENPRLRSIALKIIQLDTKFKRYQELKKSEQLHLLNEDDEVEEDYDDYETVRG